MPGISNENSLITNIKLYPSEVCIKLSLQKLLGFFANFLGKFLVPSERGKLFGQSCRGGESFSKWKTDRDE